MNFANIFILVTSLLVGAASAFVPPSTTKSSAFAGKWGCNTSEQNNKRAVLAASKDRPFGIPMKLSSTALFSTDFPLSIIIAGAPASGKGTQCEMIKEHYGVVHLSTGDMLRAAVAAGTPVGILAKEYMDSGKLVPDEVIIGVVSTNMW